MLSASAGIDVKSPSTYHRPTLEAIITGLAYDFKVITNHHSKYQARKHLREFLDEAFRVETYGWLYAFREGVLDVTATDELL